MLKRVLSIVLCVAMVLSCMGVWVFAADELSIISAISDYHVYGEILADDGYIGIPVEINTYIKGETDENSQIILYVINTNTERIGTDSDEVILADLLDRGFIVLVLDYKNNPKAKSPDLDWSCQQIRSAAAKGSYLNGAAHSTQITYVLPAGYNITTDEYYFSLDKHGADGSLERIVDVWNSDFKAIKGSKTITYADGTTKTVSEVTAESIYDCVKPDGTPIDLDLKMDIIYPTNPENKVPVMTLSSSSETRIGSWTNSKRPHLTGFLFDGYAGAIFDYAYVPMARDDHYGYFDGNGYAQSITGDNKTYSMHMYSGVKSDTAAIRKIRYLSDYEGEKYKFDVDNIGVYGNSKAGVCTRLGNLHPELLSELRYLPGHHGETRYENGDTEDDGLGIIDGGEEQPWLKYSDGSDIPSNVQFVYAQCGGGSNGAAPMYITGSMQDSSYFDFYPSTVSSCYRNDIPALYYSMPERGHELAYGLDRDYGRDTYYDFMLTANYWLKDDAVVCAYIDPVEGSDEVGLTDGIKVKFTGSVSAEEIEKVKIINTQTGVAAEGSWEATFGRTEWVFTPTGLDGGHTYRVNVPKTLLGENGKAIESSKSVSFKTAHGVAADAAAVSGMTLLKTEDTDDGVYVLFEEMDYSASTTTKLRFGVKNDAANKVLVYAVESLDEANLSSSTAGELLGEATLIGKGSYEVDVTEYVNSLSSGEKAAFVLKAENKKETKTISTFDFEDGTVGSNSIAKVTFDVYANGVISDEVNATDGGSKSAKIESFNNNGIAYTPYAHPSAGFVKLFHSIVPSGGNLSAADYGRKLNISLKVYDTIERGIGIGLSGRGSGNNPDLINLKAPSGGARTLKDQWQTVSMEYRIDDIAVATNLKNIMTSAETMGDSTILEGNDECLNTPSPFYIDDIVVTEDITEVEIATADAEGMGAPKLVLHPANKTEATGFTGAHVENADKSAEIFSGLTSGGGDVSFKSGDNDKAYLRVSLNNYAVSGTAQVKINVTSGVGEILVYGVKDNSWDADTINYLNAPGNDRFSYGADKTAVYDGIPVATVAVDATGEYIIDVSDFARYMVSKGESEMTLLLVSTMQSGQLVREANFDSGSAGFEITQGGGLASGAVSSAEDHTTGSGKSYYMNTPYKYSRAKFDVLGTANLTPEDVGRKFKLTYWMKSDKTGSFINSLIHRSGSNTQFQIATPTYTTANEWQQITYTFEITEDMFTEGYTVETVPTYINFEYNKMGTRADGGVETVEVYVDDFVLTEITHGDIAFEAVAGDEGTVGYTYETDMESAKATWSNSDGPTSTSVCTYNGFGTTGSGAGITDTENHTADGTKALMLHATKTYDRIMLYNIVDSLTADDIGRRFKVTFWAKSDLAGAAKIGITNYSDNDVSGDLGMSFDVANVWQKFEYEITITQAMVDSTAGLLRIKANTLGAETATRDIYVDDIKSYEIIVPESSTYSYTTDMESAKAQWSNSDGPTSTSVCTYNGFGTTGSAVWITDTNNYTNGGTKALALHATRTYDRIMLYNIVDSLTAEDIGRRFKVTFWAKSDLAGAAKIGITNYSDNDVSGDLGISFNTANVWQKFEYEIEITQAMVDSTAGLLRIKANTLGADTATRDIYIDDITSYELSDEVVNLNVTESAVVSNKKLEDGTLRVGRGDINSEIYTGIKKTYIRFAAGEYNYTQKATLNINAVKANGQKIKVYGVMGTVYPDELTFDSAPANAEGTAVNTNLVYGGAPLAELSVNALESYSIDVTDYIKANAGHESIFIIVNEEVSGSEYMDLDFETFSFSSGADYTSDAAVTLSNGAASVSGNSVTLKNVFGNGGKAVKAGETYVVSVDAAPAADSTITLAVVDADGNVYGSIEKAITAGNSEAVSFEYIAQDGDTAANMLMITSDNAGFAIDNIVVRCDSSVVLDDYAQLMIETAVEIEANENLSEISLSVLGGDSISVNGENVGASTIKEVAAGSDISLEASGSGEFMYWVDTVNNTILSYDEGFSLVVGSDRSLAAVYAETGSAYVTFTSMGNRIVQHGLSGITVPKDPYVYGYEFKGWYLDGEDSGLKAEDVTDVSENTEYKAGYVKNSQTYSVTVNGEVSTYTYNEKVSVTADETDGDGNGFSYWAAVDADGVKTPVCYSREYSFYVSGNCEIVAVCEGETDSGIVLVMAAPVAVEGSKLAFFAERNVPVEYEIIETGILLSTTNGVTLESYTHKAVATSSSGKGQFTIRKANVADGDVWYGAAYLIYRDTDGMVHTIYSNEVHN